MKAICNRESLLAAFALAAGVCPTRSPKAILMNLKLAASEDGSTLMGSDLEVGIRHRVLGVKVDEPGEAILPTAAVGAILRAAADEELAFESDGETLSVRGVRSAWDLPAEDPALFPDVPDFAAAGWHAVGAGDLKAAIARTIFATDPESTLYALGGVLFEPSARGFALVATDGRRLARMDVGADVEGDGEPAAPKQAVVPVKALKLVARHLHGDDPPAHVAFPAGGNCVLVRTETAVFYSRLVEGRFPGWRSVLPESRGARIQLEAGAFLAAIQQAAIATSEESRGCSLVFKGGALRMEATASDVGKSRVEIPIAYEGAPIEIIFDTRYVLDAFKVLDPKAAVQMDLVDGKNAAVFNTEDGYQYVVMPLTKDR